jgi:prepilin-type N-terminal cleavage/methylation domain-containing protein
MINLIKQRIIIGAQKGDSGFTILEILIALIAAAIIISAALQLYITQHNQLLVQDDVSEIQANARAAAELLAEEIRKTGYRLPGIVTSMEASNSDPDTLIIKYATPKLGNVYLAEDMVTGSYYIRCTGDAINELEPGDWVFIYDEAVDSGEAFIAREIDYEANIIYRGVMGEGGRAYPAGCPLYSIARDKFFISRSNDGGNPNLMIHRLGQHPLVFAENIETLDFEYHLDDGTITNQLTDPNLVRMISINVVARSFRPDQNNEDGHYRTRDFTLKVKLRNFGLS